MAEVSVEAEYSPYSTFDWYVWGCWLRKFSFTIVA